MILIRSLGDVPEGDGPWGFRAEDRVVLLECHFQVFCDVDIAVVIGINKVFLISHSFPRQNGSRLERERRTSLDLRQGSRH